MWNRCYPWVLYSGDWGRFMSKAVLTCTRDVLAGCTMWRRSALIVVAITAFLLPADAAFAATLELDRTIQTSPFTGSSVSMGDNEGSSFVPSDNSLWLSDDNNKKIYEVDPVTGAPKRTTARRVFNKAPMVGGGPPAGTDRTTDYQSSAAARAKCVLYLLYDKCSSP